MTPPAITFTLDLEDHRPDDRAELRFPAMSRRILDHLSDRGVRATVFIVGEIGRSHPELVSEVAAGGHEIGLHAWRHVPLTHVDPATFRDSVRRFMATEVSPNVERYETQQFIDREVWVKGGEAGYLCPTMPEAYGGAGVDKLFSVILFEEAAKGNAGGLGWSLHSEIVAPYLLHYGNDHIKSHYLPKMARGEMIGAIAMTEPAAGSDLQGIKTTAVKHGDHYVLNGSKTFITNGYMCDLVIVVAKTDPTKGAKGTSLLVVDTSMPGFTKANTLI